MASNFGRFRIGKEDVYKRQAYVFVLPLALLFALFPKLILGIYTDIPDLQDAAVHSLWVMCSTRCV